MDAATETANPDKDKKDATATATAGTGGDTASAVTAALAGAAAVRTTSPAAGTAAVAGEATPDATAAGAVQGAAAASTGNIGAATAAVAPANLIVGASGKTEKVAADLGAKADQPAPEAKPVPDKQEAAKLAVPAKADQAAQARTETKSETPAAKPDAAATAAKRKEATDTTAVKTADQATAPASAPAGPAKTDAAADAAKAAVAAAPPPPSNLPPTPLQTVPIVIGLQALRNGSSTFQIRLDPEELGRIEVKLHISGDAKVSASLVVDRVETLHMLQREAKTLERAFDQAGLKANGDDLQFSLRQDGRGQNGGGQNGAGQDAPRQGGFGRASSPSGSEEGLAVTALPPALQRLTMSRALAGGLDIQI